MSLRRRIVPLEDLPDMEGWVRWQVSRFTEKNATEYEFEDLVGQGVVILLELHHRWDRRKSPKFSAYAISLFKLRLIDWWRAELVRSGKGHIPQAKGGIRQAAQFHGTVNLDAGGEEATVAFTQDRSLIHYDAVE